MQQFKHFNMNNTLHRGMHFRASCGSFFWEKPALRGRKDKKTGTIYCMQSCEHPSLSLEVCSTAFLSVLGEPHLKSLLTIQMVFAILLQWCLREHAQEKCFFFRQLQNKIWQGTIEEQQFLKRMLKSVLPSVSYSIFLMPQHGTRMMRV